MYKFRELRDKTMLLDKNFKAMKALNVALEPHSEFIAKLHEGESVLRSDEADRYSPSPSGNFRKALIKEVTKNMSISDLLRLALKNSQQ